MAYDPDHAPDPDRWRALPLEERTREVLAHHRRARIELHDAEAHAIMHVAIENAVADDEDMRARVNRLTRMGLDRHEAIHAIGTSLARTEASQPRMPATIREACPPWLTALAACGSEVPPALAQAIVDHRAEAIPWLIGVVAHDVDDPHPGYLAVHAATMLGQLEADRAAPFLVRLLENCDMQEVTADAAIFALPALGEAAIEPVLERALASERDDEHRLAWFEILGRTGVQDERIFRAIADVYFEEPVFYSMCLADYGDRRGLPLIRRALAAFEITGDIDVDRDILDYVDAIESLGGCLNAREQRLLAAFEDNRLHEFPDATRVTPKKLGRNAPCWCGSGKKYKHCHWVEDAST